MEHYLVDTTVLVEHLRGNKNATFFLFNHSPSISPVTIAELIRGTKQKKDLGPVNEIVESLSVLPIIESISVRSISLMKELYHAHHVLFLDALIGATAIEYNVTLVTENIKHFSCMKALKMLDWKEIAKV